MPNDIAKLRRLMRRAHYIQSTVPNSNWNFSLHSAWWYESVRDALNNGMARFTYSKKDGSSRSALGTRSPILIPADKLPKSSLADLDDKEADNYRTIPYFDLDKNEWRSFSVLNFISLDKVWRFNDPLPFNITPYGNR